MSRKDELECAFLDAGLDYYREFGKNSAVVWVRATRADYDDVFVLFAHDDYVYLILQLIDKIRKDRTEGAGPMRPGGMPGDNNDVRSDQMATEMEGTTQKVKRNVTHGVKIGAAGVLNTKLVRLAKSALGESYPTALQSRKGEQIAALLVPAAIILLGQYTGREKVTRVGELAIQFASAEVTKEYLGGLLDQIENLVSDNDLFDLRESSLEDGIQ